MTAVEPHFHPGQRVRYVRDPDCPSATPDDPILPDGILARVLDDTHWYDPHASCDPQHHGIRVRLSNGWIACLAPHELELVDGG